TILRTARRRWCARPLRRETRPPTSPTATADEATDSAPASASGRQGDPMLITRISIKNPVFATMVMVGITVLGLFSYARLRVEQMPDVSLPFVMIMTQYPGAAPEAVEADVTKPIEYAVNQVSGVKRLFSNSREGSSQVFIEFRLSTNAAQSIQDVRDKIATVRPGFPKDVKDPLVNRVE